jgi:hypothetical protein
VVTGGLVSLDARRLPLGDCPGSPASVGSQASTGCLVLSAITSKSLPACQAHQGGLVDQPGHCHARHITSGSARRLQVKQVELALILQIAVDV